MNELAFMQYIDPRLLVLVAVLWLVGLFLKHSRCRNEHIPLLLGLTGILLAVLWVLAGLEEYTAQTVMAALFTAVVQGVLCAGASVYGHQIVKQEGKRNE